MKDISYQTGRIIRNAPVSLMLASLFELIYIYCFRVFRQIFSDCLLFPIVLVGLASNIFACHKNLSQTANA